MPRVKISFVVLNWNGLDDTLNCLESIRQQTLKDYEIIVVDNGSSPDQKQALRNINDVTLVDLPSNAGFTGGQLAALKHARGDFLALINNDAVIAKDWAETAIDTMKKYKRAAAVGGRAYQWDPDKKQKPFDPDASFYSYQVVNLLTGHTRTLTYGDQLCKVNSISGAGVLIRRAAIDDAGYFYKPFFAYYEETDLFARFKRSGWEIIYNPRLKLWHQIAKSTRSKPGFYLYYMHRNRFQFAVRNYDPPYLRKFLIFYLYEVIRASFRIARHGRSNSLEEVALVKAGSRNLIHAFSSYRARLEVKTLGGHYSKKLLKDKAESIGVIIPCYNYAAHVAEAIESVLGQTLPPDEIIVINDGSTDNSLEIIEKYKDRIKIIDQKNSGVIKTKNRGLNEINTDWVIFLDADDKLRRSYIRRFYDQQRIHNADVVYCSMKFIGEDKGVFKSRPFTAWSLRRGNYINNSALMRRDLLLQVGGYKTAMDFGYEDWELYLALAEIKARFRYLNRPLLYYRRHALASRDKLAQAKLKRAHKTVRELHPQLFSARQRRQDFINTLLTFYQRRRPMQVLMDVRYSLICKLDTRSQNSALLNKGLGFARLLKTGDYSTINDKIGLNIKRLWQKVGR